MSDANPIMLNNYAGNIVAPASAATRAIRPMGISTVEDALNILNLVNTGGEVLDVKSLGKDNATLISIASEIVKARKNGSPVQFENGRIMMSKELFGAIVRSAENTSNDASQMGRSKLTGRNESSGAAQKSSGAVLKNSSQQNMPMFAPPPPYFEMKKRKEKTNSPKVAGSATVKERPDDDMVPMLSASQAYYILIDIVPPGGGRYVMHLREKFEFQPEEKNELEKGLEEFWRDFGNDISVNARHTSIVVKPKILIGNLVNCEVSKKLVFVYVSQSTKEKLSRGALIASSDRVTIRPSKGNVTIDLNNKKILDLIFNMQTTISDSGKMPVREDADDPLPRSTSATIPEQSAVMNPFSSPFNRSRITGRLTTAFRH
ncbi:MAG: hypothetical protein NTZ10_05370 [Candidatus Saganbacteria bacterium]|nr:hypothetical protein [Candidatus Saganbacteria bacterium]